MAKLLIASSETIRKEIADLDDRRAWLCDLLKAAEAKEARDAKATAPTPQAEPEKAAPGPEPSEPAPANDAVAPSIPGAIAKARGGAPPVPRRGFA